ncbi:NAD(P)H-dependent oxidoreductase [Natronospora cellulosivora (SeqCode)]
MSKKVLTLLGSTRGRKTASESIVNYLFEKKEFKQMELSKYLAHEIFKKKEKLDEFLLAAKNADTIIISSPVYVHSLPYPLTVVLESMADKENKDCWQGKNFFAIIHCGYPEEIQRKASLDICKNFANQTAMNWMGGIGFAGTPIIDGRPLEEVGMFTKWMRKALDELCISIIQGTEISQKAYKLAKKDRPPIPVRILKTLMNIMIKKAAKKNKVDFYAQPYIDNKEKV